MEEKRNAEQLGEKALEDVSGAGIGDWFKEEEACPYCGVVYKKFALGPHMYICEKRPKDET